MNKYERLKFEIELHGYGRMKGFGNSMLPVLVSGSTLTYVPVEVPKKGDIVLCKVRGRWIDAHRVTKVGPDGRCMIANNRGRENGWTRQVWGRVVHERRPDGSTGYTSDDWETVRGTIPV